LSVENDLARNCENTNHVVARVQRNDWVAFPRRRNGKALETVSESLSEQCRIVAELARIWKS
jgi:hypothetical protein